MRPGFFFFLFVLVILAAVSAWLLYDMSHGNQIPPPPITNDRSSTAPAGPTFDQSISDATITISYPSSDFGLATNPSQILVRSNIPPCDSPFSYCLYYNGPTYQATNFE